MAQRLGEAETFGDDEVDLFGLSEFQDSLS